MSHEMAAIPRMIYGTAWKKERTAALVTAAVRTGFRAVDTAAQRKHYRQDLVGQAIATLSSEHGIKREQIFLQTKYTSISGQDANGFIPYDVNASISEQVASSFENSLKELQTTYIDSLLLHGPESTVGKTVEALLALKPYIRSKQLRYAGISNLYSLEATTEPRNEAIFYVGTGDLDAAGEYLADSPAPNFSQNRFYKDTGYDADIRNWCKEHEVIYQSFWTLTANPQILNHRAILGPAQRLSLTPEQVFYQFCIQEGMIPLNGTTDVEHMHLGVQVLQGKAGELTDSEMQTLRSKLH